MGFFDAAKPQESKSIEVITEDDMDEPHVLQQRVLWAGSTSSVEVCRPMDKHRIVPLSDLLES